MPWPRLDYTEDEIHVVGTGNEFYVVAEAGEDEEADWVPVPDCGGPFRSAAEAEAVKRNLVGPA